MRVEHPVARADDGIVDDAVDINGELVAIDDGTFELPDGARSWLDGWAAGYGYEAEELLVDTTPTCDTVKTDGDVCGRELPCPYHSED